MRILLRNFTVLTPSAEPIPGEGEKQAPLIKEGASIVIEDGRIKRLTDDLAQLDPSEFDKVIEGQDRLVMPGLVNAHTHLATILFRSYANDLASDGWLEQKIWSAEHKLTGEAIYWSSLLGIAEMIRSGTTAFADMCLHMDKVAQAVEKGGMRALLSYSMIAPEYDSKAKSTMEKGLKSAKDWDGRADGRIKVALAPYTPYTCAEVFWRRTVELAQEYNIIVHTHLVEIGDEVNGSYRERRTSPVQYLEELGLFKVPVVAAHCMHLSDTDIDILASRNVSVVHNPTGNMKLAADAVSVDKLLKAGVNVALGTNGALNNNLDMWEELRLAALIQKVGGAPTAIPAGEAIKMGTFNGARALNFEDSGALMEGMKADLIIMNLNRPHLIPCYNPVSNLVYSANSADVESVIIDGRIIMEEREILTIDEEEVKNKVQELSKMHLRSWL